MNDRGVDMIKRYPGFGDAGSGHYCDHIQLNHSCDHMKLWVAIDFASTVICASKSTLTYDIGEHHRSTIKSRFKAHNISVQFLCVVKAMLLRAKAKQYCQRIVQNLRESMLQCRGYTICCVSHIRCTTYIFRPLPPPPLPSPPTLPPSGGLNWSKFNHPLILKKVVHEVFHALNWFRKEMMAVVRFRYVKCWFYVTCISQRT